MLVGRLVRQPVSAGDPGDIDVTRSDGGALHVLSVDFNKHSTSLLGSPRIYFNLTTYFWVQFSGIEVGPNATHSPILTNLGDDSGYSYRLRRTSGDAFDSDTFTGGAAIGVWSAWRGGTTTPTQSDAVQWHLNAPGTRGGSVQVQLRDDSDSSIIIDRSISLSMTIT
jgi:hypothetical protein